MIELLLPEWAIGVECREPRPDALLFPDEAALIANAVLERRLEFKTGRSCAREALSRIDIPSQPILSGRHGNPVWPVGVVGSLTHCVGYYAAAVAKDLDVAALGIDSEPHAPLPAEVLDAVLSPFEHAQIRSLAHLGLLVDRIVFCAKEAVYKAWYPAGRGWLGFEDVNICLDEDGTFSATASASVVEAELIEGMTGQWGVEEGIVLATAFALPRRATSPENN